jgi:hypothetical protein
MSSLGLTTEEIVGLGGFIGEGVTSINTHLYLEKDGETSDISSLKEDEAKEN